MWGSKEGQEWPTLNSRAPATRHIGSAKEPWECGHSSRRETLEWGVYVPFPRALLLLLVEPKPRSWLLHFFFPLLLSWANTAVCSLNNWGDCEPGPAYSPKHAPMSSLRVGPLASHCFLGFLSLRVLPKVWGLNRVQTPGIRG